MELILEENNSSQIYMNNNIESLNINVFELKEFMYAKPTLLSIMDLCVLHGLNEFYDFKPNWAKISEFGTNSNLKDSDHFVSKWDRNELEGSEEFLSIYQIIDLLPTGVIDMIKLYVQYNPLLEYIDFLNLYLKLDCFSLFQSYFSEFNNLHSKSIIGSSVENNNKKVIYENCDENCDENNAEVFKSKFEGFWKNFPDPIDSFFKKYLFIINKEYQSISRTTLRLSSEELGLNSNILNSDLETKSKLLNSEFETNSMQNDSYFELKIKDNFNDQDFMDKELDDIDLTLQMLNHDLERQLIDQIIKANFISIEDLQYHPEMYDDFPFDIVNPDEDQIHEFVSIFEYTFPRFILSELGRPFQ